MDKYEYRVKTEQMLDYMEKKQYKKAMEIADTIDWRRVKNASMLNNVSEIYEYNGEFQKSRDILFLAYDRSPGSRKIVYRLGTLALKINDIDEASDCYEEFVKLAPKDPNQYILKYKILKSRRAPITEQIEALEDFKKAEYVEKWAYELANLYHEAGMTAECLEECDDLILWFSEGKYVYQAMELKMKYKPLTPLQQEKYNNREKEDRRPAMRRAPVQEEPTVQPAQNEDMPKEDDTEEKQSAAVQDKTIEIPEIPEESVKVPADDGRKVKEESPIRKTVKGATLAEALANGVAVASGLDIEEKASTKRDEDMRITGQMKIEEILAEWESKQKANAQAIETQKKKDEEALAKKRKEAERRRLEEARRIEEQQRAAEEARRIAEQKAAEEARRLAEQKAEEERRLAEEKALEEKRLAEEKAAEEERLLERLAAGKSVHEFTEPRDVMPADEEEFSQPEETEEAFTASDEEEDSLINKTLEELMGNQEEESDEDYEVASYEEEQQEEDEPEESAYEEESYEEADLEHIDEPAEEEPEEDYEEEKVPNNMPEEVEEEELNKAASGMTADLRQLMEELEKNPPAAKTYEEEINIEEAEYEDSDYSDMDDEFEEEYEESDYEEEYEEDGFEDYEDDFEEYDDVVEEETKDIEEDDFFDEEEDIEEPEPEEKEEEELVIEEPTEEEIQKRIKKGKGGVPFDTGFVVTGRYDLSATSEIGLKAGLTEEQKKLFSYFVPVRGMSEQIVEVLDNDRREQREGTSRTGNILVIGHKGSGKTVLAVDIVKAIQKQRNLKQGKVAIVTGESLNKKELSNIIQKLRGGAIIIEKAGKLNTRTVKELNHLMEKKTGELLFVLEDQRKPLERLFMANPEFKKKFTSSLELPVFINDELVTFGQTYAKENGYKLDEMGILALYSRIDVMQREDHAVTVAEVKEMMDAAIEHSQKANVKHLARRVFGKGTDDSDRIILKEEDFKI